MERTNFEEDSHNKERRNVPNEELCNIIKKTGESFWLVEDTLNNLFDAIYKNKSQLHESWNVLQKDLDELMIRTENIQVDLTKDTTQDQKIKKYQLEIKYLKRSLKNTVEHLQKLNNQNEKNSSENPEENAEYSDNSMETWVNVPSGTKNDSIAEDDSEVDKTQLEKKKEGEPTYTEKQFQDVVQMINDFYECHWIEMHTSLLEGGHFKSDKIYDILFYTFWEAYRFICEMLDEYVKKLSEVLYFPIRDPSQPLVSTDVPIETENILRELILKFKSEDKDKIFKENLVKLFSAESVVYIEENPKFMTYIKESLHLIRQMCLKHRNWFLKSHKISEELDNECFIVYHGPTENCKVEKVIFPVLLSSQDGKMVVIRKGVVTTILNE